MKPNHVDTCLSSVSLFYSRSTIRWFWWFLITIEMLTHSKKGLKKVRYLCPFLLLKLDICMYFIVKIFKYFNVRKTRNIYLLLSNRQNSKHGPCTLQVWKWDYYKFKSYFGPLRTWLFSCKICWDYFFIINY